MHFLNRSRTFLLFFFIASHGVTRADPAPHFVDGVLIHRNGVHYKIVHTDPPRHMKVIVTGKKSDLPSELVVQVKKQGSILNRFHVALDETQPDGATYTGLIPANILISGGITFDLEF